MKELEGQIADFQWLLKEFEECLDLLKRYDHKVPSREEYSKEFILFHLLEIRGMLTRLRIALERVPQPVSEEVRRLLRRTQAAEEEFEQVVHAAGLSLLESLKVTFTPEVFLKEVDDFITRTQETLAEKKVPSRESWEEEAVNLFLERDKLALLLEGAQEIAQKVSAGSEARRFLDEACAVAEQVDTVMQANLIAFTPARGFLSRYRARFNTAKTSYWWWQVELPKVPEAVRWNFSTLLDLVKRHLGGYLPSPGILFQKGKELAEISGVRLQDLMLDCLREPVILRGEDEAPQPQPLPILVLDDQGTVVSELLGLLHFGPKIEAGKFFMRLQLPDQSSAGSPGWVAIDLGEHGPYVIPTQVMGDVIGVSQRILENATGEIPASLIKVAILPSI